MRETNQLSPREQRAVYEARFVLFIAGIAGLAIGAVLSANYWPGWIVVKALAGWMIAILVVWPFAMNYVRK